MGRVEWAKTVLNLVWNEDIVHTFVHLLKASIHLKVFSRFRSFSVQEIDNDGKLLSLRDLASSIFENLCFVLIRLKKWPNCVQAGEGRRVTPCSEDKRCVTSQIRVP